MGFAPFVLDGRSELPHDRARRPDRRVQPGYGARWTVEMVISAVKRMLGEDLMARRRPDMVREVVMVLAPYDRWAAEAASVQG